MLSKNKEKKNPAKGLQNYFSLPRRKKKKQIEQIEISAPLSVTGLIQGKLYDPRGDCSVSDSLNISVTDPGTDASIGSNVLSFRNSCVENYTKAINEDHQTPNSPLSDQGDDCTDGRSTTDNLVDLSRVSLEKSSETKTFSFGITRDVSDDSGYGSVKSLTSVNERNTVWSNHLAVPLESDYDTPKSAKDSGHDHPKSTDSDYDLPKSTKNSDNDYPKSTKDSDYDYPKSPKDSDFEYPKSTMDSDYDYPKSPNESNFDNRKSVKESDYDCPKSLNESKFDISKSSDKSDYDVPRPSHSDYKLMSAFSNTNSHTQQHSLKSCPNVSQVPSEFGYEFDSTLSSHELNNTSIDFDYLQALLETNDLMKNIMKSNHNSLSYRRVKKEEFRRSHGEVKEAEKKTGLPEDSWDNSSNGSPLQVINESAELDLTSKSSVKYLVCSSTSGSSNCQAEGGDLKVHVTIKSRIQSSGNANLPIITVNDLTEPSPKLNGLTEESSSDPFEKSSVDGDRNCVARALYNNVAESPDELEFRKDDLLTVLEQNTAGLEGWWLCSLRGRQGICPGNRLRIVPGCYDVGTGVPTLTRPHVAPVGHGAAASVVRSSGNKVVTPKRIGDTYTYDTPRRLSGASPLPLPLTHHPTLDYDVPRGPPAGGNEGPRLSRSSSLRYEAPRHLPRGSYELHDVPHDQHVTLHYDVPRAATSTLYDSPKPQMSSGVGLEAQLGAVPTRSLIKGIRGPQPNMTSSAAPVKLAEADAGQYDVPKPWCASQNLDVPTASDRSSGVSIMSCDSTSSSASSAPATESPYLSSIGGSSNRSSLDVQDVYDVPPEPRKVGTVLKPRLPPREYANSSRENAQVGNNVARTEGVYDVPPQVSRDARPHDPVQARVAAPAEGKCDNAFVGAGLPLEYDSAVDMLAKVQQDLHASLEKLTNFNVVLSPTKKLVSDDRFAESKIIIERLKDTLREFITFSEGSSVNAYKSGVHPLAKSLQEQIERLSSTYDIIKNTWDCAQHDREQALEVVQQLTSIAKPLADDVRHLAQLIHTNAPQIFKRTPSGEQVKQKNFTKNSMHEKPTRDVAGNAQDENLYANESAILEDYDYVKLESRETAEREHQHIKESLPVNLRKSYDNLVKQSLSVVDNDHQKALSGSPLSTVTSQNINLKAAPGKACRLDANDRQVLSFYSNQAEEHIQHLNTAIDAFFLTIEENQPPKVFIAHSKFVILSAHKLVFIGDTVHRNVVNSEVRSCVLNCSNALCDAMKNTVAAAKTAAIQFPSVSAVQAMVDSFTTISNLACNLRNAICRN
ncbi:breast cancer anti-estrogen resistance protein 1 isoform X1 [Hyalella azteca]|uniref:Breast cancer anti-estrogen resistance protein 1 isoform X1 n=1 Tax=Hyalella azteca TaxID=294128 RepID=A0A8B7N3Y3_HYAAZ|nr:breast cancer anti-estrogen resistance protein 1 isoform X1 [Hyalella azteca]